MPLVFLILAFALSYLLTPFVSRFASRCGAVDFPGERKVHEGIIPRFGGVAIFASFVFVIAGYYLWFTPSGWIVLRGSRVFGIAAAGVLIFALGVYDDLRGTNAWVKFSVQLVAAFLIVWNGDVIRIVTNPAGGQINLGILAVPVTILWLVGVTNAFNLIDGADGVACGIGAIVAGTMAFVGAYNGNYESATIAATLCGALLGFLRYNFYPAKIFMGDSGALFVGFCLAALAIKTSQVSAATVSFLTPIVALGLSCGLRSHSPQASPRDSVPSMDGFHPVPLLFYPECNGSGPPIQEQLGAGALHCSGDPPARSLPLRSAEAPLDGERERRARRSPRRDRAGKAEGSFWGEIPAGPRQVPHSRLLRIPGIPPFGSTGVSHATLFASDILGMATW
jgi:UDP-GlcNAc:undecaprenyl-phosphate GlcNAc-1-phosphate transferase